jgi:hypothetical protein
MILAIEHGLILRSTDGDDAAKNLFCRDDNLHWRATRWSRFSSFSLTANFLLSYLTSSQLR